MREGSPKFGFPDSSVDAISTLGFSKLIWERFWERRERVSQCLVGPGRRGAGVTAWAHLTRQRHSSARP